MKEIIQSSDDKRVLVIGNGFDLDLGWNTRFSDYAQSKYWPENRHTGSILYYLEKQRKTDNWFDVEKEIGEYASGRYMNNHGLNDVKINTDYFNQVVAGFKNYLLEEIKKPVDSKSIAAVVLSEILENQQFSSIYSFNYTDLYDIARQLDINKPFVYEHVHGSIKNDDVILGAPEDRELNEGYKYLYKTFNEHYKSNELIYDLNDAKEVVFFGHSLGPTDYHYFRSFFQAQCQDNLDRAGAKKITIFTFDDASRLSILNQLRTMNDKKTSLLVNKNDFKIHMTKKGATQELELFLQHLRNTSKDVHMKRFAKLVSII